jgi:undecaprenyl-diphosphatase
MFFQETGQELLNLAVSPVHGDMEDYLLAAAFGGGMIAALNHDMEWYHSVQGQRNAWQDEVMPPATFLGEGWVNVGGMAMLYVFGSKYDRKTAIMATEGLVGVALVSTLVKVSFTASRPSSDDTQRRWFTGNIGDSSFVSGHTMTAFCTAVIIGDAYHLEWLTYPLAGLVAYSRMYNRNHWPSDVVVAAGLGLLIGRTVVAYHASNLDETPLHFSVAPLEDGTQIMATWCY